MVLAAQAALRESSLQIYCLYCAGKLQMPLLRTGVGAMLLCPVLKVLVQCYEHCTPLVCRMHWSSGEPRWMSAEGDASDTESGLSVTCGAPWLSAPP